MRSILFSLLLSLPFAVRATTPAEALKAAVDQLSAVAQEPDQSKRVSGLCTLANGAVDANAVAQDLLGSTFANLSRDAAGIASFDALVPSIMVTDFYSLVSSELGEKYWVDTTAPQARGNDRVGYPVYFGDTKLVFVMSKTSLKVVDAEWNNISMVQKKHDDYQKTLQAELAKDPNNSLPVTALVNQIQSNGSLMRCN